MLLIELLYEYRNFFQVYAFNFKEFRVATRVPQRFETCNNLVVSLIKLPATAIFARKYFLKNFKTSAEILMLSATKFLQELHESGSSVNETFEHIAGYPTELIENSFLDKLYQNLTLQGNESLVESYQQMYKFNKFIQLLELDREELKILKTAQHVGENAFSCSLIKQKLLCKF